MTTAWTAFKASGSGRLALRLKVSGIPYEAVTDSAMTATASDGSLRVPGLLFDGVVLEERVHFAEATCEPSSFTATMVDVGGTPWTSVFSKWPTHRTWLTTTIDSTTTTFDVISTSGWPSSGVFYIDQEAVTYSGVTASTFTGCTRGAYGSVATYHYALDTTGARAAEITNWPLTMEGRHVQLFAYAGTDTLTGDGTQVWLGIVSRDAKLSADQCAWELSIDPITRVFDAPLGGDLAYDFPARGIYYNWQCCFLIACYVSSDSNLANLPLTPTWSAQVTGFYETQEDFVAAVNASIAANATTAATGLGLSCQSDGDSGFHFELVTGAGASNRWVGLVATSPLDMVHQGGGRSAVPLLAADSRAIDTATYTSTTASTRYVYQQNRPIRIPSGTAGGQTHTDALDEPGAVPRGSFASTMTVVPDPASELGPHAFQKTSAQATAPANIFYVGGDTDMSGITWVTVDFGGGTPADGTTGTKVRMAVTPTAATRYFTAPSDCIPAAQSLTFAGLRSPRFSPSRLYVNGGTLHELRDAVINATIAGAPLGNAPYLYDISLLLTTFSDFNTWDQTLAATGGRDTAQRIFITARALNLGEVLREEAKNIGCFFALDTSGRIQVYQMGVAPTGTTWTIGTDDELVGEQPTTWERNALGSLGRVIVKTGYDPIEDKFNGPTYVFTDRTCYGRNPTAQALTIAPKSERYTHVGGIASPPGLIDDYTAIAATAFGLYGYPYDIITVAVPFTFFDAVCGDSVSITSKNLPSGGDGRGMSARNGVITGRRWDFAQGFGVLTILSSEINWAGYTPTSRVSSQVDNGGNNWTLTIATPAAGATAGYSAATAWAVNDKVRVVVWDSTTSTVQVCTVTAVTATTVRVQFAGVWTPGASTWNLEYDVASSPWQTSQQTYCAVADGTTDLITYSATAMARQFAP